MNSSYFISVFPSLNVSYWDTSIEHHNTLEIEKNSNLDSSLFRVVHKSLYLLTILLVNTYIPLFTADESVTEDEVVIEYSEIEGLSSTDEDSDDDYDDYEYKRRSKVQFSRSPIKVSNSRKFSP